MAIYYDDFKVGNFSDNFGNIAYSHPCIKKDCFFISLDQKRTNFLNMPSFTNRKSVLWKLKYFKPIIPDINFFGICQNCINCGFYKKLLFRVTLQ